MGLFNKLFSAKKRRKSKNGQQAKAPQALDSLVSENHDGSRRIAGHRIYSAVNRLPAKY